MILVLGRTYIAAVIGEQLTGAAGEYWMDIGRGVDRLKAVPHRFQAVLAARSEAGEALLEAVMTGGGDSPTLVWLDSALRHGEEMDQDAPVCGVEQSAGGGCRLRCAPAELQSRPARQPSLAAALGSRPVSFIYSAPVHRGDSDEYR